MEFVILADTVKSICLLHDTAIGMESISPTFHISNHQDTSGNSLLSFMTVADRIGLRHQIQAHQKKHQFKVHSSLTHRTLL